VDALTQDAPWSLRMPPEMMGQLDAHLFPGDRDEHGAVIGASIITTPRGARLLGRRLFLARDGADYVPGKHGYRMLTPSFVLDCAIACADEGLAYLAVHCHGGTDRVALSGTDLASHVRGYPAVPDILDGPPAGGLVFARNAAAGDIWLPDRTRLVLDHLQVAGRPMRRLHAEPPLRPRDADERYDRQARIFGDRGQALLATQKVAVIGAGGAGSLIIEYLARLGVGHLVVIDPERIDVTNLSRVVGSRRRDTRPILTHRTLPRRFRQWAERLRTPKVRIAERVAREAQPGIRFDAIDEDVTTTDVAQMLVDCDYVFLAADSMQARLVVNAVVHQYLIPGIQVGAKVQVDRTTGDIVDIFSVVRPIVPGLSCLWCNGLISPSKLQEEATDPEQLARQRYVDEPHLHAPSVITLNAVASAHAVNDYLISVTGMMDDVDLGWRTVYPRADAVTRDIPLRDENCPECSLRGRLGAGRTIVLPTRAAG
jgi:molybdopterin/thiamine biosynthesis adenylyltransferase